MILIYYKTWIYQCLKESQYMVSRPELGSDLPFESGRESGRDKLVSKPRFRRFWKVFKISDAPT